MRRLQRRDWIEREDSIMTKWVRRVFWGMQKVVPKKVFCYECTYAQDFGWCTFENNVEPPFPSQTWTLGKRRYAATVDKNLYGKCTDYVAKD